MLLTTPGLLESRGLGKLMRRREIDLSAYANPQGVAREEVRTMLKERLGEQRTDDAVLVADELVGNAVQHGDGPVSLALALYERGVAVEVVDRGTDAGVVPTTAPAPADVSAALDPSALPETGRGMCLIAALATAWTAARTENGKVVRAVLVFSRGDE